LVDDDGISNHLHKMLIEDLSIAEKVEVAYDGEEALKLIENGYAEDANNKNDILVLMDINMPGMDAFDFLTIFQSRQERFKNLHIVLLSSSLNFIDKEKAREYQVLDFMVKPLTEEKLEKIVDEISSKKIFN
jgi:YesN/AraC family two-component response regulator